MGDDEEAQFLSIILFFPLQTLFLLGNAIELQKRNLLPNIDNKRFITCLVFKVQLLAKEELLMSLDVFFFKMSKRNSLSADSLSAF